MPTITVFTPTYNRAYILPQLYKSLCEQSSYDFEWLIVDDGSTDDTEVLIKQWLLYQNPFSIKYLKKENGGKPRAINYGIAHADGDYFFMVDSDDYLCKNAIALLLEWIKDISDDNSFIGVGAARGYDHTTYIKGCPPKVNTLGFVDASNLERAKYDLDADMCEAYRTNIFKKFPMAEWPKEKFAPEQIALNEIALSGYKLRWHREIIYICEYREDGLTKGSALLEKNNPMGYAMMYNHKLKYGHGAIKNIRYAMQMTALALYGRNIGYLKESNCMWATVLTFPFGALLSLRRKHQYSKL